MAVHIGDQFYDRWQDEYFTVVAVDDGGLRPVAYLQYETGMPSVEPLAGLEDQFDKLDKKYVDTESTPRFQDTCATAHIFNGTGEVPKCENCSLSAGVLSELLGETVSVSSLSICACCGGSIEGGGDRRYGSRSLICDDCWRGYEKEW